MKAEDFAAALQDSGFHLALGLSREMEETRSFLVHYGHKPSAYEISALIYQRLSRAEILQFYDVIRKAEEERMKEEEERMQKEEEERRKEEERIYQEALKQKQLQQQQQQLQQQQQREHQQLQLLQQQQQYQMLTQQEVQIQMFDQPPPPPPPPAPIKAMYWPAMKAKPKRFRGK